MNRAYFKVLPALAGCFLGLATPAFSTPVSEGFDLFTTPVGAFVDLTGVGMGIVTLQGRSIGPGNTDTIVHRLNGLSPFNVGDTGIINIEMYALSLMSVASFGCAPVGGTICDLYVTINNSGGAISQSVLPQPDVLLPTTGVITATHTTAAGGTFDSFFNVFADLIFTVPGGNPANVGDRVFTTAAPQVVLTQDDTPWTHLPPPFDQHTPEYPAGDFYPAGGHSGGPHPVFPSNPEPATLALFASGLGALALWRRRRSSAR